MSATRSGSVWSSRYRSRRQLRRRTRAAARSPRPSTPAAGAQIGQRLHQGRLVQPVARRSPAPSSPVEPPGGRRGERPGPPVQGHQVTRADPPARPGEQPQQRRAVGRVGEHPQRADHVAYLGGVQQAAQADHLDRQAPRAQRRLDRRDLAAHPDQHGGGRALRAPGCARAAPGIRAAPRQAASTLSAIQSASSAYVGSSAQCTVPAAGRAAAVRSGRGRQRGVQLRHPGTGGPQRRGQRVGHAEDLRPVAPARGEARAPRPAHRRRGRTRSGTGPACRRWRPRQP